MSTEDELFLDLMKRGVYMDQANCWIAPLPFRLNRPRLANNRQHDINRLSFLRRRNKTNPRPCKEKCWVLIFSSLVTRVVHIEVLESVFLKVYKYLGIYL